MRSVLLSSLLIFSVACSTPTHYRITTTTTVYRTAVKLLTVSKPTKHKHKPLKKLKQVITASECRIMLNKGEL